MMPNNFNPVVLAGSPEEMGRQHAGAFGADIRLAAEVRLKLCEEFPSKQGIPRTRDEILRLASACRQAHVERFPGLSLEIDSLAAQLNLSAEEVFILNGYTDFLDLLFAEENSLPVDGACTAFALGRDATKDGLPLIGQTWDMNSSALPFVCLLHLQPENKPSAMMISLMGCVGMIGMNSEGLVVCTNNLHAKSGRVGVFWPVLMRAMLECGTLEDALALLRDTPVAGAHNYLLMDRGGRVAEVEKFPGGHWSRAVSPVMVHTNHCRNPEARAGERIDKAIGRASSEARLSQAEKFLNARAGRVSPADLMELCRLEETDVHNVCMQQLENFPMQTCAAIVMSPATGELWALKGRPTDSEFQKFHL